MACFNCSESPAVAGCPFGRDAAPSAVGITMPSWRHNQIDLSRSRPPPSLPQTEAASSPDRVGAASQETRRTRCPPPRSTSPGAAHLDEMLPWWIWPPPR